MPPKPAVSVILPAWNSHQTVAACLNSLRTQTFRDFEVILVDLNAVVHSGGRGCARPPHMRTRVSARAFQRGFDYGMVRPRLQRWGRRRTLAYVVGTPLTVLWLLIRAFCYATPTGHFGTLVRCLPIITIGYTTRQIGEALAHWRLAWRRS